MAQAFLHCRKGSDYQTVYISYTFFLLHEGEDDEAFAADEVGSNMEKERQDQDYEDALQQSKLFIVRL